MRPSRVGWIIHVVVMVVYATTTVSYLVAGDVPLGCIWAALTGVWAMFSALAYRDYLRKLNDYEEGWE